MWVTSSYPTDWLPLDGREISRTQYPVLFTMIGTFFGAGDGSTTFNLPNMEGRFPSMIDGNRAVGGMGGDMNPMLVLSAGDSGAYPVDYGYLLWNDTFYLRPVVATPPFMALVFLIRAR